MQRCPEYQVKSFKEELFEFPLSPALPADGNCISHFAIQELFEVKISYLQHIALTGAALTGETNPTFYMEGGLYYGMLR